MLAAATLASLALFCHGQHAPPTPEQERQQRLKEYAETRAHFGFRSDIPYIEELIRRGRHESDVGYVPVTRAEDRYLRLRDRIGLGDRAYRYLRKRRELSGGVSIEDGWPGEPYLLVRLTRDRAMHEANLRRLVPFPRDLRTVEVTYSDRELRRLGQRIWNDERELAAVGFDLRSLSVDVDTNTAEIGFITQRTTTPSTSRSATGRSRPSSSRPSRRSSSARKPAATGSRRPAAAWSCAGAPAAARSSRPLS